MEGLKYLIVGILPGAGVMFLITRSRFKVSAITKNEISVLDDNEQETKESGNLEFSPDEPEKDLKHE